MGHERDMNCNDRFCFENLYFFRLFPFFLFATKKSGGPCPPRPPPRVNGTDQKILPMRELIYIYSLKEKLKKKTVKLQLRKMSKAIEENIQKVKIKRLVREFNLYWKFTCTNKNNDKNKMNIHPSPFYPSYSFLNCWKTTKSMTLKFSDFQFVFINVL